MELKNINNVLFDDLEEDSEDVVKKEFEVKDLQSANWCLAKYINAGERIREAEEMRRQAIEHVEKWFKKYILPFEETRETMEGFLAPYVSEAIKDIKSKSIKLMGGTCGYRKTQEAVLLPDDMVEKAKALGIPVQVKEYVNKTDVKEYVHRTGHMPEGTHIVEPQEKFYIKEDEPEGRDLEKT